MKNRLLLFLIAAVITGPCYARWGATFEECVQRYGKETKVGQNADGTVESADFLFSDIKIKVFFQKDVATKVAYERRDGTAITAKQLFAILSAYSDKEKDLYFLPMDWYESRSASDEGKDKAKILEDSINYQTWIRFKKDSAEPLLAIYNRKVRILVVGTEGTLFAAAPVETEKDAQGL